VTDPARTETTAWFHCFSGIAGDMALGALIDAGADLDEVRTILDGLDLGGWQLEAEGVMRNGIGGTKAHVLHQATNVVRTAAHIEAMLDSATLPDRVRHRSRTVFRALAIAEGHLHRQPPEQVHFHEVGAVDAIIDIVGTCAALEVLGVDRLASSPVANGLGTIRAAHGILPNPPPAVVELLKDVPSVGLDLPFELTTPTGAALVAALAEQWGPMPDMVIRASGFGAGTRELEDRPNMVQVVVGTTAVAEARGVPVTLIETNLDDVTGEVLAHAVAALMDAGAHDAWVTPIVMKKGRPAHLLSALADVALVEQIVGVMRAETGSFGVRATRLERWPGARTVGEVDVDGDAVRVKVGPGRIKAEYDDAAAVASRGDRPVREVISFAEAAHAHDLAHGHDHVHHHETDGDDQPTP
jgi:pyridinium-3,5-bisthiocarboxylic acid mononucleotide nickel chelatase